MAFRLRGHHKPTIETLEIDLYKGSFSFQVGNLGNCCSHNLQYLAESIASKLEEHAGVTGLRSSVHILRITAEQPSEVLIYGTLDIPTGQVAAWVETPTEVLLATFTCRAGIPALREPQFAYL